MAKRHFLRQNSPRENKPISPAAPRVSEARRVSCGSLITAATRAVARFESHHHTVGNPGSAYLGSGSGLAKRSQRAVRVRSMVNWGTTT